MLDEFLIRHSAPTLAGLKTANLFWYPWENREELKAVLEEWQKVFQEKCFCCKRITRVKSLPEICK